MAGLAPTRRAAINGTNPIDIVGLEPFNTALAGIHDGRDGLTMIVRVAEAQNMAEFVYGNPMEIVYWGTIPVELLWPRIRVPQLVAIKK